jgi:hypothetical protein
VADAKCVTAGLAADGNGNQESQDERRASSTRRYHLPFLIYASSGEWIVLVMSESTLAMKSEGELCRTNEVNDHSKDDHPPRSWGDTTF